MASWVEAVHAAARELDPRTMVAASGRGDFDGDDVAEPVTHAFVLAGDSCAYWFGVTATGMQMPIDRAIAAFARALGLTGSPLPASLDERRRAIAGARETMLVDVKLSQLLATSVVVVDAVP
jgi:hypothetical protein